MPTCAVEGCGNSSKKKFKMNSLPRNPTQRALWIKNIGRPYWIPKENEAVCEVHFPPEMWEKTRVDGTRKLKFNAVPTIFGNQTIKESPNVKVMIPREKNQNNLNFIIPNPQTMIQIVPANWLNLQQTQSIIPTPSASLSVNSKSVANNPKSISVLKPRVKVKNLQTLISPSKSSLTGEKVRNQEQKKIIISRSNDDGPEKKPVQLNLPLNSINLSHVTEVKPNGSQAVLYPATRILNAVTVANVENVNTKPPIILNNLESLHQQKSERFTSSEIFLNKSEAKKREDERFEKMDKLLMKQLKLNNALRNKLSVLRARIRRLVQKQNDSESTLFLKKVFTDDQIRVLQTKHLNPKSVTTWSDNTMLNAIKLKRACGLRGYKEILNQNLPYPCFRTIKRWCAARNLEIP